MDATTLIVLANLLLIAAVILTWAFAQLLIPRASPLITQDTNMKMEESKTEDVLTGGMCLSMDRLCEILGLIEFREWTIGAIEREGLMYLRVSFPERCVKTGETTMQFGRKWYISRFATQSEVVQTALLAVLTAMEHEVREQFTYRGRAIFGPHFDVEDLVALVDGGSEDARQGVFPINNEGG